MRPVRAERDEGASRGKGQKFKVKKRQERGMEVIQRQIFMFSYTV